MNPYLENPELWSSVHSRLMVAIADELIDHLSEKCRVEIEKHAYFSSDADDAAWMAKQLQVATDGTRE